MWVSGVPWFLGEGAGSKSSSNLPPLPLLPRGIHLQWMPIQSRIENSTPIRRTTFREAYNTRVRESSTKGPSQTPRTSRKYRTAGFKGGVIRPLKAPRNAENSFSPDAILTSSNNCRLARYAAHFQFKTRHQFSRQIFTFKVVLDIFVYLHIFILYFDHIASLYFSEHRKKCVNLRGY